jgi:ribonuclease PH
MAARADGRAPDQLRPVTVTRDYLLHPEGSVLVEFGATKVICTATLEDKVPSFLKGQGLGWVTAEYGMLPRSTNTRMTRENRGPSGRSQEIQRLVGRALRAVSDRAKLGERTVWMDCDVIQADGGTRTAAITGGFVALALAVRRLRAAGKITGTKDPIKQAIAAISAGIIDGEARVDLPYVEDSQAEVDCNFVMTEHGGFVEIQATAEKDAFSPEQYGQLVGLATGAMTTLLARQREALDAAKK